MDKAKFLQLKRENKELRSLLKNNETLIQSNIAQIKDARSQAQRLFSAILPHIRDSAASLDVETLIEQLNRNQIEFTHSSSEAKLLQSQLVQSELHNQELVCKLRKAAQFREVVLRTES